MHELGIAESILDTIRLKSKELNGASIKSVGLRIGALSNIVDDALHFAFTVIAKDTEFAYVELEIERCPVQIECLDCGRRSAVADLHFRCDKCGSGRVEVIQGYELEISHLEIESNSAEK